MESVIVDNQNDSLCAKGKIRVINWNKKEGIQKKKGESNKRARLLGVSFAIEKDTNEITLIYDNVVWIVD